MNPSWVSENPAQMLWAVVAKGVQRPESLPAEGRTESWPFALGPLPAIPSCPWRGGRES